MQHTTHTHTGQEVELCWEDWTGPNRQVGQDNLDIDVWKKHNSRGCTVLTVQVYGVL